MREEQSPSPTGVTDNAKPKTFPDGEGGSPTGLTDEVPPAGGKALPDKGPSLYRMRGMREGQSPSPTGLRIKQNQRPSPMGKVAARQG